MQDSSAPDIISTLGLSSSSEPDITLKQGTGSAKGSFLLASAETQLRVSQLSTQSTICSTQALPLTPTSSIKGHSRFPSASTLASSPPVRASMDSYISKRPLAQLREHPEERESETVDTPLNDPIDHFESFPSISRYTRQTAREEPPIDYDWAENLPFDDPEATISVAKRRRADKSTPSILSTKIAARFPSFSRKLRSRSEKRSSSITDGLSLHDSFRSRSRTNSMRSAATRESSLDIPEHRDASVFPTPRTSYIEEEPIADTIEPTVDVLDEEPEDDLERGRPIEHPGLSRTPLLPPVFTGRIEVAEPVQSPLQSPKVAETPVTSPPSPYDSPLGSGIPSPPLSKRPSVASFHHRPMMSASSIPPIALGSAEGPVDEWTLRLGHENFTIQPEPCLPSTPTYESCRQLKADWELAEREFGRHLARTRAHYSATSNIALLTEEKWTSVNSLWQSYHTRALSAAIKVEGQMTETRDDAMTKRADISRKSSLRDPVPMAQIPSHLVGGKFPNFGDAGIVGPMEVVKPIASAMRAPKSRKRGFWRFLQDLIPGALVSKA